MSQKVAKWRKEGAILIIIVESFSMVMYILVSFLQFCRFSCLLDFLRNKFTLIM